jgi:hypothetical protein
MNTQIALSTLSLSALATVFNSVTDKPIKKFSSKPEGLKRTEAALETAGKIVVADGEGFKVIEPTRADDEAELEALEAKDRFNLPVDDTTTEGGEETGPVVTQEASAPAPEVTTTVAEAPKAKGKRGPKPIHADDHFITVLVDNPKRVGTASYVRFEIYETGMTVGAFVEAGGRREDLHWDAEREFIAVTAEAPAAPESSDDQEPQGEDAPVDGAAAE